MIGSITDTITLHNGMQMPGFGLGCWKAKGDEVYQSVRWAVECGYRMIDTAARYENEAEVGRAMRDCGVAREQLFLVSKLWPTDFTNPAAGIDRALRALGVDYLDGFLLHWPGLDADARLRAWETMLRYRQDGKIRCAGVSNFLEDHMRDLITRSGETPTLNQIEVHPWYQQRGLCAYCSAHGIRVTSWGPIFHGHLAEVPMMEELGKKYGKSAAQMTLRWHVQKGFIVIPKSVRKERLEQNAQLFDFSITNEDMQQIDTLECGRRFGSDPMTFDGTDWSAQN